MADTKLLIGWYDAGSKRFCYTDVKDTFRKESYTIPVYAHLSDDIKQLKNRIKELEEIYLGQIRVVARSRLIYKERVERIVILAEQALKG